MPRHDVMRGSGMAPGAKERQMEELVCHRRVLPWGLLQLTSWKMCSLIMKVQTRNTFEGRKRGICRPLTSNDVNMMSLFLFAPQLTETHKSTVRKKWRSRRVHLMFSPMYVISFPIILLSCVHSNYMVHSVALIEWGAKSISLMRLEGQVCRWSVC